MKKNYVTPAGFKKLQSELHELKTKIRPEVTETVAWAASNGDRSENGDYIYGKKKLRQIDSRIRFLSKELDAAEVINPLEQKDGKVRFGATVRLAYEDGNEKTFSIVGVSELDVEAGRISWQSPLAKAMMNKEEGDVCILRSPKGEQEIEILDICYKEIKY